MQIENVPYKPQYNGIEKIWAQAKWQYRNKLLKKKMEGKTINNKALIEQAFDSLSYD